MNNSKTISKNDGKLFLQTALAAEQQQVLSADDTIHLFDLPLSAITGVV
jgi:hypothetical protein